MQYKTIRSVAPVFILIKGGKVMKSAIKKALKTIAKEVCRAIVQILISVVSYLICKHI